MSLAASNPLFPQQTHLSLLTGLEVVWRDYTGLGVSVGVFDDGVQAGHPDLLPNYNAFLHVSGDDGQPNSSDDGHGTAVAGLIGAANNGSGGVGVAYNVSLTGVDYLNDSQSSNTLRWASNFDVMNNSWGVDPNYSSDIGDYFDGAAYDARAFAYAAANGRAGLGTITVKSAGNDANSSVLQNDDGIYGNAQGDGLNSAFETITVGATDASGLTRYYSNYGLNLLVAAPEASVTTDLVGGGGYSSGEYATDFGGTSSAAPLVSGVAALMLQANPNLGWRDVQNILAASASHTGSGYGAASAGLEYGTWQSNVSGTWNGGGMTFHQNYGYGLVDPLAAVRLAEIWHLIEPTAQTSANTRTEVRNPTVVSQPIQDFKTTRKSVYVSVYDNIAIEHLTVNVDLSHTYMGDLTLTLVAPDGGRHVLFDRELNNFSFTGDYTFGLANLRGTYSVGKWTLEVYDNYRGDTGTLRDFDLNFSGQLSSNNTDWIFTDDFWQYAGLEPSRRGILDKDGGTDTVVMAAVTGDVAINMNASQLMMVNGVHWATFAHSDIENLILGDGNDLAVGNVLGNTLRGQRGNDTLQGMDGDDELWGGAGNDVLHGGTGQDRLVNDAGNDQLFGGEGNDTLLGGAGRSILNGEAFVDGFDTIGAQVVRLYQATLNRSPDDAGYRGWINSIGSGQVDLATATAGFVNSAEFQATYGALSDGQFITLLYQNVLGRTPDATGFATWSNALASGASRASVVLGFSESTEFQDTMLSAALNLTIGGTRADWTDEVFRLYQATLDRLPDLVGFANGTNLMGYGESLLGLTSGFVDSVEFQATYGALSNEAFVTLLYSNVLGRSPDSVGLATWVNNLNSGMSRESVVLGFSESPEFIASSASDLVTYMRSLGVNDTIVAGVGSNILFGGWMSDQFIFDAFVGGTHRVADFETWDVVELRNSSFADASAAVLALNQVGDDVVLVDNGVTVTFEDVHLSLFSTDTFVFG